MVRNFSNFRINFHDNNFFVLDSYEIYSPTFFDKLLIIPISVTCGLIVTFITKPTDESVLKNFFLKLSPLVSGDLMEETR